MITGGDTVTSRVAGASIVAMRLRADTDASSGGSATLSVPGSTIAVTVPNSVISHAGGDVVMLVADLGEASKVDPTVGVAALAGPQASVRMLSTATLQDAEGTQNLVEPILVTLLASRAEGIECAFWNETTGRWSSRGLSKVESQPSGSDDATRLVCSTSHLTVFAAILGKLEEAAACANVKVFSSDGLKAIFEGDWWGRPPAVLLWTIVLFQSGLLLWTARRDIRDRRQGVWRDADFLTTNRAYISHDSLCSALRSLICQKFAPCMRSSALRARPSTVQRAFDTGTSPTRKSTAALSSSSTTLARSVLDTVSSQAASKLALHMLASKHQIAASDLRKLIRGASGKTPQGSRTSLASSSASHMSLARLALTSRVHAERHRAYWHFFRSSGFLFQVWMFYATMHPWMKLGHLSITIGAFPRALFLTAKLLGALALSALYFDASGEALNHRSPEVCEQKGLQMVLWRNIAVGLCSAMLSMFPIVIMLKLSRRRFVYGECWDDGERRLSYMRWWRFQDVSAVVLGLLYCWLCTFYLLAFFANIGRSSEASWLVSAAAALLREFIFLPLMVSLLYVGLTAAIARWRPDVIERVHAQLGFAEADEQGTVDLHGHVTHVAERPTTAGGSSLRSLAKMGCQAQAPDGISDDQQPISSEAALQVARDVQAKACDERPNPAQDITTPYLPGAFVASVV